VAFTHHSRHRLADAKRRVVPDNDTFDIVA